MKHKLLEFRNYEKTAFHPFITKKSKIWLKINKGNYWVKRCNELFYDKNLLGWWGANVEFTVETSMLDFNLVLYPGCRGISDERWVSQRMSKRVSEWVSQWSVRVYQSMYVLSRVLREEAATHWGTVWVTI